MGCNVDGSSKAEGVAIRLHEVSLDEPQSLEGLRCQLLLRSQMESLIAGNQDLRIYSREGVILIAALASPTVSLPVFGG